MITVDDLIRYHNDRIRNEDLSVVEVDYIQETIKHLDILRVISRFGIIDLEGALANDKARSVTYPD